MVQNLLAELFGLGGAQAAEVPPSTFTPPVGDVPMPIPRPANLGQVPSLPTAPTIQTPEAADPGTPSPMGNILARLDARRSNTAGANGEFAKSGGGAGIASGAAAGMGHSKFGAFANGLMLGMKANSDAKAADAASKRQSSLDDLTELKTLFGIDKDKATLEENKRYHDILGARPTASGRGGSGGAPLTPATIELARTRAATRLGLMEKLPQYATVDQKKEWETRRAEAQSRFEQWESAQPWAKAATQAPATPAAAPTQTATPQASAAPAATPQAAAPAAAPAAPAAERWLKVRDRNTGSVSLYNPDTKQFKPLEGE